MTDEEHKDLKIALQECAAAEKAYLERWPDVEWPACILAITMTPKLSRLLTEEESNEAQDLSPESWCD